MIQAVVVKPTANGPVCKWLTLGQAMENYDLKIRAEEKKKIEKQEMKLTKTRPKSDPATGAKTSCHASPETIRSSERDRLLCARNKLKPRRVSNYVPYPFERSDPSLLDKSDRIIRTARLRASRIVKNIKKVIGPQHTRNSIKQVANALKNWEHIIQERGPRPEHESIEKEQKPQDMWKNIYGRIKLDYGTAKTRLPFWQDMFAESLHDAHLLYNAPVRASNNRAAKEKQK